MSVSLPPSALTPPSDPRKKDEWLTALEADISAQIAAHMGQIVRRAFQRYTDTLTAGGDINALSSIATEWGEFVRNDLDEVIGGMHLAGSLTAWVQSPGAAQAPAAFQAAWAGVQNQAALDYLPNATNRIVGAGDATWRAVQGQVSAAVAQGQSVEDLKGMVEKVTGYSEQRADTIARTEVLGAYNAGDYSAQQALGEYGPVEKQWLAALDNRTRESHAEADGQTVKLDEDFDVGGIPMAHPLAEGAPPEEVVNCRCIVLYLYPGDTRADGSVIEQPEEAAAPIEDAPVVDEPPPAVVALPPPAFTERTFRANATEQTALDLYQRGGYQATNRIARGMSPGYKVHDAALESFLGKAGPGDPTEVGTKIMGHLDEMIQRTGLANDSTLYRGIQHEIALEVGSVVADPGFSSTSFGQDVAKRFASREKGAGTVLRIKAPAGTRGVPLSGSEQEFVLGRNAQLKVTAISTKGKLTFVDMELVG